MDEPRTGESAASVDTCSFPTHSAVSSSPLFVTFPTAMKHLAVSPGSATIPPQSRPLERGRVFLKTGLTVAQNKCLTPVTVSQQAQTRGLRHPLLLRWRLSPPTPDFTTCRHLKSSFCLCHFISKTSFRPEESFSNHFILQTTGGELLNSDSSQHLWDFLEMGLMALFFGQGI